MNFIDRKTDQATLAKLMSAFPVTAILGPRQCGKTTLARTLAANSYFEVLRTSVTRGWVKSSPMKKGDVR